MNKAVAYVRVSTNEQVQGTSLDSQERICKEYAKEKGYELLPENIFREEGESARFAERPQLLSMLRLLRKKKGEFKYCIVYKIDRLARDTVVHSAIRVQLNQSGVQLLSATEPISDDPMGKAFEGILAVFAQLDNDIRTVRTTTGMKERTIQGAWPHDAPIGYKKMRMPTGASSIEPGDQALKVKKVLEEFSKGFMTINDAIELCYESGIRQKNGNRRGWQSTKNMLSNCLYAGFVRTKYTDGEMIKGLHQPLITEETFYRIQSIIAGNGRAGYGNDKSDYPLRGFIKHICGQVMTGSAPTGSGGRSPRYSCPKCRSSVIGKPVSTMREKVHDQFIELLAQVTPTKKTADLFRKVLLVQWNASFKEAANHTWQINKEIESLENMKSRTIDLFIKGDLTMDEKDIKLREYSDLIGSLRLRKIDSERYKENHEQIIDGAMMFMTEPGLFWNVAPTSVKKHVQSIIFPTGLHYDCSDGFRTPKNEDLAKSYQLINKITPKGDSESNLVEATGMNWNLIQNELLAMSNMVRLARSRNLLLSNRGG